MGTRRKVERFRWIVARVVLTGSLELQPSGAAVAAPAEISLPPRGPFGVAATSATSVDVLTRGADGLIKRHQWTPAGSGEFEPLPPIASQRDPELVAPQPGRLDAFVLGADGAIWHTALTGGSWANWYTLGGRFFFGPAAVSWSADRLDVFAHGWGGLWHRAWTPIGWSQWETLGGDFFDDPAVASWGPDRLDVFARGWENSLWHRAWGPTGWSAWESLGREGASTPTAVSWGDDRIDLFAFGHGERVWGRAWTPAGWSSWYPFGGDHHGPPDVTSRAPGTLDLFVAGADGKLYLRQYTSTGWSVDTAI